MVANTLNTTVSVLLGLGDGTFKPQVTYRVVQHPNSVASGDFNGDGKLDLAVGLLQDFAILLGNGDGTFQPAMVTSNQGASFISSTDLNRDGKLDLIYLASAGVTVQLGNGDGTFQPPTSFSVPSAGTLVVADLNGDGNPDVVGEVLGSPGGFYILLGKGNGKFSPSTQISFSDPGPVAVGDFNLDGQTDVIVSQCPGSTCPAQAGQLSLFLGRGDGTFQQQRIFPLSTGVNARNPAVGDFNGDGKADVAVINVSGNDVSVLLGNGDGTFQHASTWSVGPAPLFILASDFNGDGLADLEVSNSNSGDISVLLSAKNTFLAAPEFAAGSFPEAVVSGDFNGDGRTDLAFGTQAAVTVILAHNHSFAAPVTYPLGTVPVWCMAVGDLNGDGHLDLLAIAESTTASGQVSVLLGNGDGTFQSPVGYSVGINPVSVVVGDFNGDGIPDVAVTDGGFTSSGDVSLLLGNGDGTLQPARVASVGNNFPRQCIAGDFNGDGKLDLALVNSAKPGTVDVILGNGDGTFQPPTQPFTIAENAGISGAAADVNQDGKLDLLVVNALNEVSVVLGNGDGTFSHSTNYKIGQNPSGVVVADFNGDTKLDLVISSTATNVGGIVSFLSGNGDGTFNPATTLHAGANPVSLTLGDFDADGQPDVALVNITSNTTTILLNTTP